MRCVWGVLPVTAASMMLVGCGGGGGGTNSAGSVAAPPSAPAASNTTLTDLRVSQNFTNDATVTTTAFDLTTKTVVAGNATKETLTVSYDAGSKSYSVAASGRSQTFAPAEVQTTDTNQTIYTKTDGTVRDRLTLVKVPFSGTTPTQYVGLGFWQRNVLTSTRQETTFDTFTYGLTTAAAAVPRVGTANFAVDVFGLSAFPGSEPMQFQGRGSFAVDFTSGLFSTNTNLTEHSLVSDKGTVGGGIQLQAAGHLSSGDGTFSGNMLYGSTNGSLAGTFSGRFYGPNAEELGASFSGSSANGASVNGSLTGQRDGSAAATNLTLTNLIASQNFYTREADLTTYISGYNPPLVVYTSNLGGGLTYQNSETFFYGPGTSALPGGQFTAMSAVASSDPNFRSYHQSISGQDVKLDLYKPGSGNTELALTYASFGRWRSVSNEAIPKTDSVYFVYGLDTQARSLGAKTGTGHYVGIAYGAGANRVTGTLYDVKGASSFDVNFSDQSYQGALALKSTGGSATADFGSFTFSGKLSGYSSETMATLMQNGVGVGGLTHRFFGPDGEEIGGPFTLSARDGAGNLTSIVGIALAKRQ